MNSLWWESSALFITSCVHITGNSGPDRFLLLLVIQKLIHIQTILSFDSKLSESIRLDTDNIFWWLTHHMSPILWYFSGGYPGFFKKKEKGWRKNKLYCSGRFGFSFSSWKIFPLEHIQDIKPYRRLASKKNDQWQSFWFGNLRKVRRESEQIGLGLKRSLVFCRKAYLVLVLFGGSGLVREKDGTANIAQFVR